MRVVRQFFAGLVENALYSDVGVGSPEVVDYLSELLSTHLHINDLFPFKENNRLISIDRLYNRARTKEMKRNTCRHVGDFAMFWTGLYPENIKNLHSTGLGFSRKEFVRQGKKFYQMAAINTVSRQKPPAHILEDLSQHFDDYCYGLSICRNDFS